MYLSQLIKWTLVCHLTVVKTLILSRERRPDLTRLGVTKRFMFSVDLWYFTFLHLVFEILQKGN